MRKTSVITLTLFLATSAAHAVMEEDVRYKSNVPLAAALLVPEGLAAPAPGAVIVQGSGPSDRRNAWARSIAELFVARGFVVLLTDKRGSWQTAGFDDLANDAAAGVDFLKSRKEVDGKRIGLLGLSQGGWVVPLAAVRRPDVAFVVDLSGATVSYAEQSFLEMTNTARQAGLTPEGVNQIIELNKAAGRFALGGSWEAYASLRAAAMSGPAKSVASGFPASSDAPIWTFLRKVGSYEPTAYWSVLDQPVFIGFGERDEEDNVPVRESVRRVEYAFQAAGKKNYDVVVAPGVGHALWNEKREFAPLLIGRLDTFLRRFVIAQ